SPSLRLSERDPPRDLRSLPTRRSSDLFGKCPARSRRRVPSPSFQARASAKTKRQFNRWISRRLDLEAKPAAASTTTRLHQAGARSEERTSELQSLTNLVCRLPLDIPTH